MRTQASSFLRLKTSRKTLAMCNNVPWGPQIFCYLCHGQNGTKVEVHTLWFLEITGKGSYINMDKRSI